MKIQLAGIVNESVVDGPGIRWVLFVQGCSHRCYGCHNSNAQDPLGGYESTTDEVIRSLPQNPLIRGITFSGGEPFEQPDALAEIARVAKQKGLSLFVYSGYKYEDLLLMSAENPSVLGLLQHVDVLVDGPFVWEYRDLDLAFRGSGNQRLINVSASLQANQPIEWNPGLELSLRL